MRVIGLTTLKKEYWPEGGGYGECSTTPIKVKRETLPQRYVVDEQGEYCLYLGLRFKIRRAFPQQQKTKKKKKYGGVRVTGRGRDLRGAGALEARQGLVCIGGGARVIKKKKKSFPSRPARSLLPNRGGGRRVIV